MSSTIRLSQEKYDPLMNTPLQSNPPLRQYLFIGGAIVFVAIAVAYYFMTGSIVSTDDAEVVAARVDISASVAGRVTKIFVKDNQTVHQGDPLFALDSRDEQIAVEDARAALTNTKLSIEALQATEMQHQAEVLSAVETLHYQQHNYARQHILAQQGIASQAQLELAQHQLANATQQLNAATQSQHNISALLGHHLIHQLSEYPTVQQAQAKLDRAQLNLSYTLIKAPMDGVVSKVDLLQVGEYINAAAPVFALISNQTRWIEANFKENKLTHMQAGQKATITIDAYPDQVFHGRVDSFSAGTGSSFSLLPPENATGNWVKVVQRVPVRIQMTDLNLKQALPSGLSVTVQVDTRHSRLQDF